MIKCKYLKLITLENVEKEIVTSPTVLVIRYEVQFWSVIIQARTKLDECKAGVQVGLPRYRTMF